MLFIRCKASLLDYKISKRQTTTTITTTTITTITITTTTIIIIT